MNRRKLFAAAAAAGAAAAVLSLALAPTLAQANEFSDLRGKLSAARESLVTMLTNKDKRGADHTPGAGAGKVPATRVGGP